MAETKKKLPKSEWDFSGLEPVSVPYAFFYEYARQSDKVKKLVAVYRELIPYGVSYDSVHTWSFEVKKISHLSKKEERLLFSKTNPLKVNEYLPLISWLAYCENFPDTPFLKLAPEDYLNGPMVPINSDRFFPINSRGFCDIGYCWIKDFKEFNPDVNDRETTMKMGRDFLQPVDTSEEMGDHVTMHWIRVDWWKNDSELEIEFAEWLKTYRDFLKVRPIKSASRGLWNRPLDLPKECKKLGTALTHLGKLRCLEASGTWEKYLTVYQEDKSDQRSLAKDISAARKIIAWLEEKV